MKRLLPNTWRRRGELFQRVQRRLLHNRNLRGQPLFAVPTSRWRAQLLLRVGRRSFASFNPEKDYYKTLDLDKEASLAQIKSAYYKLAKKWHPDLFALKTETEKTEAKAKFREIQEAHECLSDKERKIEYDTARKYGSSGRPNSGFGQSSAYQQYYQQQNQWRGHQQYQQQRQQQHQTGQEDFWKRQQDMYERMEQMKKENPERFAQQEQARLFLQRMWMGLLMLLGAQIIFGLFFRPRRDPYLGAPPPGGGEHRRPYEYERFNQQRDNSGYETVGQHNGMSTDSRFRRGLFPAETSQDLSGGQPTKIFVIGDELPPMYLNPRREWRENRPTYRTSRPIAGTSFYFIVYHEEGEWRVALSQYIGQKDKSYARVMDSAMNPAEIQGTWKVFDRRLNRYESDSNFRLSLSENPVDAGWA